MLDGRRGLFVTFEGGDATGKTTQVRLLAERLERLGVSHVVTKEPGGTDLGRKLTQVLLAVDNSMTPLTEALLFATIRAEHVQTVIRPALAAGKVVLCDRFTDSSAVYQGFVRGVPLSDIEQLTRLATGGLEPDLTILLDLPVETALARMQGRGREKDRLEAEGLEFHRRVREAFLHQAALHPERFRVVDASRPVAELAESIWAHLEPSLAAQGVSRKEEV